MGLGKFFGAFDKPPVTDNFTLIATNTTKYYLELTRDYSDRFSDEASLLATAGVLDAQNYVFVERTISLLNIRNITATSVFFPVLEDMLADFILNLEIETFKVDNPNIPESDIVTACVEQRHNIANTVQKTKNEYVSEPIFASAVSKFMSSPEFQSYRQELGIKD